MRLLWWTNAYTLMCFCLLFLVSLRLAFSSCVTALFSLGLFWGLPRSHRLSSHSRLNAFVIQTKLGPQNLQECCHKLAGETWVSITHNCLWATLVLKDMIHVKSSHLLPSHLRCGGDQVCHLWQLVYHHKQSCVSIIGLRQLHDEVHGRNIPCLIRDWWGRRFQ